MNYEKALSSTSVASQGFSKELRCEFSTKFPDFVRQLSPDKVNGQVIAAYAQDAYFNDTLKELYGRKTIADYMEKSLDATTGVSVEIKDISYGDSDFYYRWTMKIFFKTLNKGNPAVSDGMSQIRYTEDGLISLHRDFWDAASGIFEYLPVFRSAIPWVKGKL